MLLPQMEIKSKQKMCKRGKERIIQKELEGEAAYDRYKDTNHREKDNLNDWSISFGENPFLYFCFL